MIFMPVMPHEVVVKTKQDVELEELRKEVRELRRVLAVIPHLLRPKNKAADIEAVCKLCEAAKK